MGDASQQIFDLFSEHDPDKYNHIAYGDREVGAYVKMVKLAIIGGSFLLTLVLLGDVLIDPAKRVPVATANLILVLIEGMVFLIENALLKENADQKWPWIEGISMALAMPGAFLLMAPILKYSSGFPVINLIIQMFLMFYALRFLKVFSILTQRSSQPFTSRIWRRIFNNIPLIDFLMLGLILIVFLIPFAMAMSEYGETNRV